MILRKLGRDIKGFFLRNRYLKRDRRYLRENWGENTLKLPLSNISELKFQSSKNIFSFNPSLIKAKEGYNIYVRESNLSLPSESNIFGKFKERVKIEKLRNGITLYKLNKGVLEKEREVISLSTEPNYEDPRALSSKKNLLQVNKVISLEGKSDKNWSIKVGLLSGDDLSEVIFQSPNGERVEKNWSYIPEQSDDLYTFIYKSNPLTVVKFNKKGELLELEERVNIYGDVNGGPPLLKIKNGYLRICRKSLWYKRRKMIRVNYLSFFDEELREIKRSKPFILNKLGNEICNGAVIEEGIVKITWSHDDLTSYIGQVELEDVLNFIEKNPHKLINDEIKPSDTIVKRLGETLG